MKKTFILGVLFIFFTCFTVSLDAQYTKIKDVIGSGVNGRVGGDGLGNAIAIDDSILVAAARWQDFDENGKDSIQEAGAVYVFYKNNGGPNNWGLVKKIVAPSPNDRVQNSQFGWSVDVSGNTIVVGSWHHYVNDNAADSAANPLDFSLGAAFVYSKDVGGKNNWGFVKKLVANGPKGRAVGDGFGFCVGVSGDIVAVGAYNQSFDEKGEGYSIDAGAVYMYYKDEGGVNNWGLKKKLVASGFNDRKSDDNFGYSLDIEGDVIVVGAPNQSYDAFGAYDVFESGAAYVFYKDHFGQDSWGLRKKLVANGPNARKTDDRFGCDIAISQNTIVVGACGQDFDSEGRNYIDRAGASYIFSKNHLGMEQWGLVKKIVASGKRGRGEKEMFGEAVAISKDIICVGVQDHGYDTNDTFFIEKAGAVFVYSKNEGGSSNWGISHKLVGTGTSELARRHTDKFGQSIRISNDTIYVGAPWSDFTGNGEYGVNSGGRVSIFKLLPKPVLSREELNIEDNFQISSYGKNLLINFLKDDKYDIEIRDILGRNVITKNIFVVNNSIETLSMEGVASGYYIVNIKSESYYKSTKVFIE